MGDTSALYCSHGAAMEYFSEKDYLNAAIAAHWCRMYSKYGEPYGIGDITPYDMSASKIYFDSVKKLRFPVLSKSTFLMGTQCTKSLWLHRNKYSERSVSSATKKKFNRGHIIGELAQHLFPNGIDASEVCRYERVIDGTGIKLPFNLAQLSWIEKTTASLHDNIPIYEAALVYDDVFAAVDILVPVAEGKYIAYEVKSSTHISDTYILDNALQYYVISNNVELADFVLVHLNEEYLAEIDIPLDQLTLENCDIDRLFVKTSVLDRILPMRGKIRADVSKFKRTLKKRGEPKMAMGEQCSRPYECAFSDYCTRHQK